MASLHIGMTTYQECCVSKFIVYSHIIIMQYHIVCCVRTYNVTPFRKNCSLYKMCSYSTMLKVHMKTIYSVPSVDKRARIPNPAMCFKLTRGDIPFMPSFPELGEKADILKEMCKRHESRIEELMENAKLKSQLSAVDRTSQSYHVREYIYMYTHTDRHTCAYRPLYSK